MPGAFRLLSNVQKLVPRRHITSEPYRNLGVRHVFVTMLRRSYAILLLRMSALVRSSMKPADKERKQFS